jgi:hypothetical protein
MASTYLLINFLSQTPTNRQKYTKSFWVKRSALGAVNMIFYSGIGGTANADIDFASDDKLNIYERDASSVSWNLKTNRVFRDVGAWYHIVIEADSTQSTSSDRIKLYVNGVQETSFGTATYPNQNINFEANNNSENVTIGRYTSGVPYYFNGYFSHYHFIDGTAYDASTFGEYDAQNVWKPKTQPSVTYGTNGFFLKFANSGSLGTDSSGNDNDFTVNGTGTQTLDTPSNVFTTWNPLENYYQSATLSNGNTTIQTGNSQYSPSSSTLGVSSGKWYWEVEYDALSGGSDVAYVGVLSQFATNSTTSLGTNANDYGYYVNGNYYNNNTGTAYGATYTTGDIIGVALDLDNNKLYFSKNGTFQNSGDPTSGATGTGAISITDPASTTNGAYFPSICDGSSSANATFKTNFGNGYYGTTAVSTPNADGDGYGKFEYSVPTGYYALCTKNIQTYG